MGAREYTNEDAGFDDVSSYNAPAPKQDSGATSKVQRAALTGKADAAVAAPVAAPVASAAAIPPLDAASAPPLPDVKNPAQDGDFWKSALPYLAAPALGLLGGAAYSGMKGRSGGGGGGGGPTVDEDLRQLRLAQEQAKLDAIYEKNYRQQQLHEANLAKMQGAPAGQPSAAAPAGMVAESGLPQTNQQFSVQNKPVDYSITSPSAYGATTTNAPTGAPNVAAPPPAEAPVAAVQPKPMSEIERLRVEKLQFDLEAARNKEARAQEAHANRLAAEAKRAETKNQASQGKPLDSVETTMLKQSHQNTISKAVEADVKANTPTPKPAPVASVAPPAAAPNAPANATAPIADKFVLPISSNPAETALTKEQMSARGWLANQYGGNNKYYESVQEIFGGAPPSYNAAAGEKAIGKEAHQVVMDWRKANIEGPKVNLTHDMKKVLKGGGGMAVLMALPGFAEAAQRKDVGKMSDIFTDFFVLPFAQSREAGMSKREEESIIAGKFKEASKLGSPYRSVPPPR